MGAPLDLTGQQFGRLTALQVATSRRRRSWICRCSCGTIRTVATAKLTSGGTASCGCLQRESVVKRNTTHGLRHCAEYDAWCAMKARCYWPKHKAYARYGGRGIYVCDEWLHDFAQFLKDMGPRPNGLTIERKDNDGPYTPHNCRWATYKEQSSNSRRPRYLEWNGQRRNITEWSSHLGIYRLTLQNRLKRGWSLEKTLTTPVRK